MSDVSPTPEDAVEAAEPSTAAQGVGKPTLSDEQALALISRTETPSLAILDVLDGGCVTVAVLVIVSGALGLLFGVGPLFIVPFLLLCIVPSAAAAMAAAGMALAVLSQGARTARVWLALLAAVALLVASVVLCTLFGALEAVALLIVGTPAFALCLQAPLWVLKFFFGVQFLHRSKSSEAPPRPQIHLRDLFLTAAVVSVAMGLLSCGAAALADSPARYWAEVTWIALWHVVAGAVGTVPFLLCYWWCSRPPVRFFAGGAVCLAVWCALQWAIVVPGDQGALAAVWCALQWVIVVPGAEGALAAATAVAVVAYAVAFHRAQRLTERAGFRLRRPLWKKQG